MSPKLFLASAAIVVTAFATLPASAQDAAAPANPPPAADAAPVERPVPLRIQILFNLVDVNADGAIDQTEIAALQRAIFTAVDADKDGKITQAEFTRIIGGPGDRARHVARMMRGDDGPRGGRFFERHGPRGDRGFGPRGERGDHRRGPDQRRGELPVQPGEGPGSQLGELTFPGPSDALAGPEGEVQEFAALDLNGDGTITIEEFGASAPQLPDLSR